jgi:hypothetical protein
MNVRQPEREDNRVAGENGRIMKKVYVGTLMVILFSTVVVSFSYAQASCCALGSGCCGTSNIAGAQQQPRALSGGPAQVKIEAANKRAPQINPMPWTASVNQIENLQRLLPAAPGSQPQSASIQGQSHLTRQKSTPSASAMRELLAFSSIFGTLW